MLMVCGYCLLAEVLVLEGKSGLVTHFSGAEILDRAGNT